MKNKIIACVLAVGILSTFITGCGGKTTASGTDASAQSTAAAESSSVTEETHDIVKSGSAESSVTENSAGTSASSADSTECELEDGTYSAVFTTDSSMFHVNETCEDKGTLTVENGKMTIHVTLASKNIVNLFSGTAEDAQKDGAVLIDPTEDTVTYSDGTSETVYGFDIPVPALDEEFDVALVGTKGTWYDHKVSVTDPEKI